MEALILYVVLFFPGIHAFFAPDWAIQEIQTLRSIPFSVVRELGRLATYTLPATALLLYLIARREGFPGLKAAIPQKRDMLPFAIGLPVLIGIGLFISFLISRFAGVSAPFRVEGPYNFIGWAVMILACLGTGYLEEIYFRYYLLARMEKIIPQTAARVVFSTVLFALCHMHAGPWGVANAAIAGLFLSALFLRYRSLHGVALAHAGYNMFVYVMGTV